MKVINLILLITLSVSVASAQVATGGDFTLVKKVVAGGGGTQIGGGFEVGSTTGQPVAGGPKSADPFSIYSGFWTSDAASTPSGPCPLGQGYWKNNTAVWPLNSLILGDETYSKTQLLNVLNTAAGTGKKTDASLILAYQLIAAKLNVASGVDPTPLGNAISNADAMLAPFNGKLPYKVMSSTVIGQSMVSIALLLESFNKGALTTGCSPPPAL